MVMMNGNDGEDEGDFAPDVAQQIDENLRRLYSETVSEELPRSLTELLDALRRQDEAGGEQRMGEQ